MVNKGNGMYMASANEQILEKYKKMKEEFENKKSSSKS